MKAAGRKGIPQIVSPGAIWAFHWGADRPFPARYEKTVRDTGTTRSSLRSRSSPREMGAVGKLMAEKLNNATGPAAVVIPMKGFADRMKSVAPS